MHIIINGLTSVFYGKKENEEIRQIRAFSLLYGICIVAGIMFYYNDSIFSLTGFFVFTFIFQASVYLLYDFISEKNLIGSLLFIILFAVVVLLSKIIINTQQYFNSETKGISTSFLYWFLTPQSAMPYFRFYTYAILLIFSFFISATVYYFTVIRYRTTMTFLLLVMPLALYSKELAEIPLPLIIFLFVLFFSLMAVSVPENKLIKFKIFNIKSYNQVLSFFFICITFVVVVTPKPKITADRDYIESMINSVNLTQQLMNTLNKFSNESDGNKFYDFSDNKVLYYVDSDEIFDLKARVFNDYDYSDDSWSTYDNDTYQLTQFEDYMYPEKLIEATEKACKINENFAAENNLSNISEIKTDKSYIRIVKIQANNFPAQFLLTPTGFCEISNINDTGILRTGSGELKKENGGYFDSIDNYEMKYFSENSLKSRYSQFMLQFNNKSYETFLNELSNVLLGASETNYYNTVQYNIGIYKSAIDYYNRTYKEPTEKVKKLANEITEGKYSDLEKAEAIENYFIENNFQYDLNYRKTIGENAEDFLFKSKKGVCYEFATAMTLLARASGLPARYTEGFSVSNYSDEDNMYILTQKESHAFPEVYISGYGWMSFEPTVPSDENNAVETAKKNMAFYIQSVMAVIFIVAIVLSIIFVPIIIEQLFRLRAKKMKPNKKVMILFCKIRRIFNVNSSMTTNELTEYFNVEFGCDFSESAKIFDSYMYGKREITHYEAETVYNQYLLLYECMKKGKKKRRLLKNTG